MTHQTHNQAEIEKNLKKLAQTKQSCKNGQRMAAPPNINETLSLMFAQKQIGQHLLRSGREAKRTTENTKTMHKDHPHS